MVELGCHHCGYRWNYRGESAFYATCPRCHYKVRIPNQKVDQTGELGKIGLEEHSKNLTGIAKIVNTVVSQFGYDENMLIQILLTFQKNFGWIPREVLSEVSKQLGVPLTRVYQVATFYKAFSLAPVGKHKIRVCMGTSCKVRGAPVILERLEGLLGIKAGETTPDLRFTLETVNCLGCCALGPVVVVDGDYWGNLTVRNVEKVVRSYR